MARASSCQRISPTPPCTSQSPTGYVWKSDSWDDVVWWLSVGEVTDAERERILHHVDSPGLRPMPVEKCDEPTPYTALELVESIRSLPPTAQEAIREALAFDFENASAHELHHAIIAGFIACCDRVLAKFTYRLATDGES